MKKFSIICLLAIIAVMALLSGCSGGGLTAALPTYQALVVQNNGSSTNQSLTTPAILNPSIYLTSTTPVNAVAATGNQTVTGDPAVGTNVTIAGVVYTFSTNVSLPGYVLISTGNVTDQALNLKMAINADNSTGGAGVKFYSGMTANTYDTANSTAGLVGLVSKIKGVIGNGYTLVSSTANIPASAATFGSGTGIVAGVNGTVGGARQIVTDGTYLYICTSNNTIADAYWRCVSLGSAY